VFRIFLVVSFFSFSFLDYSFADTTLEPIVFMSKKDIKKSDMISDYYEYNVTELDSKTHSNALNLIRKIPGVDISQTGLLGGEGSVYIRGLEGKHTLILIDGIKVYDPSSIGKTFNLATLNTLDIEKIEVLKGGQSVLYGSDAIGGVINIVTKKGASKDRVSISHGYYSQVSADKSIAIGKTLLFINAFYQESEFDSEVEDGDEIDKHQQKGFTLNHSSEFNKLELTTNIKYQNSFSEVDANQADDKHAYGKDDSLLIGESIKYHYSEDVKVEFLLSYHKVDRKNKYFDSYNGNIYKTPMFSSYIFEKELKIQEKLSNGTVVYGLNHVNEKLLDADEFSSEEENIIFDSYIDRFQKIDSYSLNYGGRVTSNENYGSHLIHNLGVKKDVSKNHAVKANSSSGFKAPSIYQTKNPTYGNKNLSPEKSQTFELSYLYSKENKNFSAAVFQTEIDEVITFSDDNKYINHDTGIYKGVELLFDVYDKMNRFETGLTLLNIKLSGDKEASKRPDFSYHALFERSINDALQFQIDWKWVGRRFSYDEKVMKPYDITDLNFAYTHQSFQGVLSLINIFDREYELARGYSTLRRAVQGTITYNY